MSEVQRRVYKENDLYTIRLEDYQNTLFVHTELKSISKKIIKELINEFEIIKKKCWLAGYDYIHTYSATPKFYKHFRGYEDIGSMVWEGKEYRVLRWDLK